MQWASDPLKQWFSKGGPRRHSRDPRSPASLVTPGNKSCIFFFRLRRNVDLTAQALKSHQRHGEAAPDPSQKGQLDVVPSLEGTTTSLEHEGGGLPTVFGRSEEDPCGDDGSSREVCVSTDAIDTGGPLRTAWAHEPLALKPSCSLVSR
ncbi:hypothetical protein HPB47_000921 [Ixodes persulcatus]|uniref:Uncharacterized protein n=1 Tax=Ixodes persulcatus TaxID=34615 RepID=A0AC60PQD3_IXOPE|nr:hypothetical protein HPB47_000921 [Ixodes persulcatus]